MPRKAPVKRKSEVVDQTLTEPVRNRLVSVYNDMMDVIDKDLQLQVGLGKQRRLSTGLLVNDLIIGGGMAPGMYTFSGLEQSAKSTAAMTALGSALAANIPVCRYYDAEGAVDPDYTCAILGTSTLAPVFGDRDEDGRWLVPPRCRYSDSHVLEKVFASMQGTLSKLPDKIYNAANKQWYLVFERKKRSVDLMKTLKLEPDKALYTSTGRYWCPVDDANLQGIFILDSYPSLLLENIDEGEDEGNALGIEARAFSKYVKRVKGKLRSKGVILLGVNQIRFKPMTRGNPEYEPGGEALRFHSDCRNMFRPVVPELTKWIRDKENGSVCVEPSVEGGGQDRYQFKSIKNIKNKYGTPFRKGLSRVWIEDQAGKARGFDPVYDTYACLDMIGAIDGPRAKFRVTLEGVETTTFDWNSFKTTILAETTGRKDLQEKALTTTKIDKPLKLRARCFKLLEDKKAFEMLQNAKKETKDTAIDLEAEEEDDVEDIG